MTPEDHLYQPGYATEWLHVAHVRTGWECLLFDGVAVLQPVYASQQARYVVESDRFDFWGKRQTTGHYEYRTVPT